MSVRRVRLGTASPWEAAFGYARAIKAGGFVAVSGTVAADAEGLPVGETAYEQTAFILRTIDDVLRRAGGRLDDVVRLRVFYTSTDVADGFAQALSEAFPDGAPALTALRVAGLVGPEFLVEIEADAVLGDVRERSGEPPPGDEGGD